MLIKLPSASAVQRAIECNASLLLPWVEEPGDRYAMKGTTLHDFLYRVMSGEDPETVLASIPEDDEGRKLCEEVDLETLPRGGTLELAMAWDWRTGKARAVGQNIGREYERHGVDRFKEYAGSFDLIGKRTDSRALVVDWKSGWGAYKAKDSWQLLTGAIMACDVVGADEAVVAHVYHRDGQEPRWDIAELDAIALAAGRAKLRELAQWIADHPEPTPDAIERANLVEGPHCRYCSAYARCPAKTALVRTMAAGMQIIPASALTREQAQEVASKLIAFTDVQKRIWQEIDEYVMNNGPIQLADGRWRAMSVGDEKEKIFDATKTIAEVRATVGDFADLAIRTSKRALEHAIVEYSKSRGLKPRDEKLKMFEKLRDGAFIMREAGERKVRTVKKPEEG